MSATCPLCAAIDAPEGGEAPLTRLATLGETIVFLNDQQGCPGWCMLVLKEHGEHLAELPGARQAAIFEDVALVAGAIRQIFPRAGPDGAPPRINYECLGNVTAHIHWHVIPRHADDPAPRGAVWGWTPAQLRGSLTDDQRANLAQRLRDELGNSGLSSAPATSMRWDDLPRDTPMALLERRRMIGERAMISHITLRKGCDVPRHAHANEQICCVLSGRLRFTVGQKSTARTIEVGAGEVLHLPAHEPHAAFAIEDSVVLDVFSPPSATTGIDRR